MFFAGLFEMAITINFDYQVDGWAVKINNVVINTVLPSKF